MKIVSFARDFIAVAWYNKTMKNDHDFKSELAGAIDANKNSKILEWTINFLQSHEKNNEVVNDIKKRKIAKIRFIEYPLSSLQRTIGPQNGEAVVESVEEWVKRVKVFEERIKNKHLPAPIIATDFWQKLHVVDGNHRHEALLKSGFKKYWTIFLLENSDSEKKLFEHHEN